MDATRNPSRLQNFSKTRSAIGAFFRVGLRLNSRPLFFFFPSQRRAFRIITSFHQQIFCYAFKNQQACRVSRYCRTDKCLLFLEPRRKIWISSRVRALLATLSTKSYLKIFMDPKSSRIFRKKNFSKTTHWCYKTRVVIFFSPRGVGAASFSTDNKTDNEYERVS